MSAPLRGQVYRADLGFGAKPWLVVSNNDRNRALSDLLAVRITPPNGTPTSRPGSGWTTATRSSATPTPTICSNCTATNFTTCWLLGALTPAPLRTVNDVFRITLRCPKSRRSTGTVNTSLPTHLLNCDMHPCSGPRWPPDSDKHPYREPGALAWSFEEPSLSSASTVANEYHVLSRLRRQSHCYPRAGRRLPVPQHVLRDDQHDLTWQTDGMLAHAGNEPRAVVLPDQPHRWAGAVIATMDAPARHP
jgi:mRNA interferase MazF